MNAPTSSVSHNQVRLPNHLQHHYVQAGASGPPIVLLHGYTDSWRSFEVLLPVLARRFRVLALDQRGHGGSETGSRYAISDFKQDTIAFIEAIAGEPVYLIGHSLGSIVAQRVAARRPDLVRGLVLIGAAPGASDHPGLGELRAQLATPRANVPRAFIEEFQSSTTHQPLTPAQLDTFVDESARLTISTWRGTLDGLLDEPAADGELPIHVPALALWGTRDSVFGRETQTALAARILDLKTVSYPEIGHAPHWENPTRVAVDIETFLLALEDDAARHHFGTEEVHHA